MIRRVLALLVGAALPLAAQDVSRARALADSGRYEQAIAMLRLIAAKPSGDSALVPLGEALLEIGEVAAAESAFVRARTSPDSLMASLHLALLHAERDWPAAKVELQRFIRVFNANTGQLSSKDLLAVALACRALGRDDPQLFKDALKAFDAAIAADPGNLDAAVALAELFLEKFNGQDAKAAFENVLGSNDRFPRVLVGEARRRQFDNEPGADSLVREALEINPRYVPALVLRAELRLGAEDDIAAREEVDNALRINPVSSEALALAAALRWRAGDQAGYAALEQRALAARPHDAAFFATMADMASRVRRYAEAAAFARRGVELDPRFWRARTLLGQNLLRLGRVAEARTVLDSAFAGDPYDVWVKNTLDLLDTYSNYAEVKSPHFVFMAEKSESPLLGIYLAELAERAYETFAKRYAWTPSEPIRVEVYRSHADFSVRTTGMPGLGALGVSFGNTLAMDSPAAKDAGPSTWGSTLWHETAHAFTLGSTDHRVPRWLSEGLSVFEEHRAREGWGMRVSPRFLQAYREGQLFPPSRLNEGFVHPKFPEQVVLSYVEASLVCDLIASEWGEPAITKLLQAYGDGLGTSAVFSRVLGVGLAAFDKRFDAYMKRRYGGALAALADQSSAGYEALVERGTQLLRARQVDSAITALEAARQLWPDYGGEDSPYPPLVAAWLAKGDTARAASTMGAMARLGEVDQERLRSLANLLVQRRDTAGAIDALERAIYVEPFDIAQHEQLAALLGATARHRDAVRERQAVVALAPVDRAEAFYQLALAYRAASDVNGAKRAVLQALEEAPDFELAQELLLSLREQANASR